MLKPRLPCSRRVGGRSSVSECLASSVFCATKQAFQRRILPRCAALNRCATRTQLVGAQARLTLENIVGESPPHAPGVPPSGALAAAKAKGSVLLSGETGTSKNALACAISQQQRAAPPDLFSPSAAAPFRVMWA